MGRRTILVLGILSFAAPSALLAQEQVQPPYQRTSNIYANELRSILRDIDQVRFELGLVEVPPFFCLPPRLPSKQEALDDLYLLGLAIRNLDIRLGRVEKEAQKQLSLPGAGTKLGPDYPKFQGIGPQSTGTNLNYWALAREPLTQVTIAYTAKKKEIEETEERDCAPKPPAPPKPVDWFEGLTPPVFHEITFAPLPPFHCSQDEYWALLFVIHPDYNEAAENAEAAGTYRTKLYNRLHAAIDTGSDGATLAKLRKDLEKAEANVKEQNRLSDEIAAHYEKAKKIPVIDCSTKQGEGAVKEGSGGGGSPGTGAGGTGAQGGASGGDGGTGSGAAEPDSPSDRFGFLGTDSLGGRGFGLEFAPAMVFGHQSLPDFVYLGLENSMDVKTFGVEHLDDGDGFVGFEGEGAFRFGKGLRSTVRIGFRTFVVEIEGEEESVDPMGEKLLIPFVNTPGVALGTNVAEGTAGGANVVTGLGYAFRGENTAIQATYEYTRSAGPGEWTGTAGFGRTWISQTQSLAGKITGFGIDFDYETSIDVHVNRVIFGAGYTYPVPSLPALSINGSLTGFLNFANAEGTDRVDLSGAQTISESRDLSRDETTGGVAVRFGSGYEWADGKLVFVHYTRFHDKTTPVVSREGDGPSEIRFDASDYDFFIVGVKIEF
ncbi:MAG: hypothetical protein ABIK65_03815 [Candidatus Eisenbacteria bacterium]